VGSGRVATKRSLTWEAWKWRFVGIKKECSSEPCVMAMGRSDWDERGVETPVCGPVDVPYMMDGGTGHNGRTVLVHLN